jgi:ABC-type Fe3+-hydroxamate transport system substrate-binding protein
MKATAMRLGLFQIITFTYPYNMTLLDALGHPHRPAPNARIVSLVPSITEMLCDFGLAGQVVGRTGFCIHPKGVVQGIPKVGGTKDVNLERIRALAPTHVVVNIDENEKPTADLLAQFVPHVIVTHPQRPQDNLALAHLLGGVFCVDDAARRWSDAFAAGLAALRAAPKGRPQRVLYCIWQDPWMTVSRDTYIAAMLAEIGWSVPRIATGEGAQRYPPFEWSEALVTGIDQVLLSTEPYRFTDAHADALERQLGKPVQLVDGEMMSWYGSRALAGLAYLRALAAAG